MWILILKCVYISGKETIKEEGLCVLYCSNHSGTYNFSKVWKMSTFQGRVVILSSEVDALSKKTRYTTEQSEEQTNKHYNAPTSFSFFFLQISLNYFQLATVNILSLGHAVSIAHRHATIDIYFHMSGERLTVGWLKILDC